jgi:predicted acyltransferase
VENRATPPARAERLESLDVLRALIILVMLFVNDLDGVSGVPAWMKHIEPSTADGMTFVDVVFPAFLFMVGVSIPFAIGGRLERGVPAATVWRHVLTRTLSLLVIGFYMVNGETVAKHGPLSPELWTLLTYAGIALTWLSLPPPKGRVAVVAARAVGIALLVASALLYRGNDATGPFQMRPQWWGILGLIGWAYLVACGVYVACRRNLAGVVGAIPLLYCLYVANAVGGLAWLAQVPVASWLTRWVSVGEMLGSQAAIAVAGVALGMALAPGSALTTRTARMRWAFLYGLALAAGGVLIHTAHDLHRAFIYNKNAATPPWCLVSSAITAWLWIVVYAASDARPLRWARVLVPAGQNALLAYILAPLVYAVIDVLGVAGLHTHYYALGRTFTHGFWRSVTFAVAVVWVAGVLQRRGVRLQL